MTTRIEPRRLWFALVAAPAAWTAQGLVGWFFGARICTEMSIGRVRMAVAMFSLAALAVAIGGLLVGVGNWREVGSEIRPVEDRVEFMSASGLLVSIAFVVAIAWAALNAVFINVCGGMR